MPAGKDHSKPQTFKNLLSMIVVELLNTLLSEPSKKILKGLSLIISTSKIPKIFKHSDRF